MVQSVVAVAMGLAVGTLFGYRCADAQQIGPRLDEGMGPNQIMMFTGGETNLRTSESAFTTSVLYRFQVGSGSRRVALGPTFEVATFDHWNAFGILAEAVFSPTEHVELSGGPGLKIINGDLTIGNNTRMVFRMSAGYELAFPPFTVTPRVGTDFSSGGATLVYGFALGYRFKF